MTLFCATLAYNLARHDENFRTALLRNLECYPSITEKWLNFQLENMLFKRLKSVKAPTVVVIDALDECIQSREITVFLKMLFHHINDLPLAKFFITSRLKSGIREGMHEEGLFRLSVVVYSIFCYRLVREYLKDESNISEVRFSVRLARTRID